jgi:hypothetical protein
VFDVGLQVLASAGVASLYRGSFAAGARFGFGSPAQRALNSARIDAQVGASVAGRQASRLLVDPIAVQNSRFLTTAQALRILPSTLYEHTLKSGSLLRRAAAAGAVVNFTSGLAMQGPALYDFVVAQDENDLAYLDSQARALQIEEAAAMQDALPESDQEALRSIGIEFPTLSLNEASTVGDIAAVSDGLATASEDSPEYPWRLWSPSTGATQTLGGQTTAIGQGVPPAASELGIDQQMEMWDQQNPDAGPSERNAYLGTLLEAEEDEDDEPKPFRVSEDFVSRKRQTEREAYRANVDPVSDPHLYQAMMADMGRKEDPIVEVPVQYWDQDDERIMENMDAGQLLDFQALAVEAGLIDPDSSMNGVSYIPGVLDVFTERALGAVLGQANEMGESWPTTLQFMARKQTERRLADLEEAKKQAKADFLRGREPFFRNAYKAPDYSTLSQDVIANVEGRLGRKASKSEITLLANQLLAENREHFEDVEAARQANYATGERIALERFEDAGIEGRADEYGEESYTLAGPAEEFDMAASFEEKFREQYQPELDAVESSDKVRAQMQNMMAGLNDWSSAMGG